MPDENLQQPRASPTLTYGSNLSAQSLFLRAANLQGSFAVVDSAPGSSPPSTNPFFLAVLGEEAGAETALGS